MKLQRHIVVPALLAIYAIFMAVYFGKALLLKGEYFRFYGTIAAEIIVITLTFFALRRRDRLRQQRRDEDAHNK